MFGWIKKSAVYEVGFIDSSAWDEESSSYKVTLPKEVLEEAVRVIDKGYLFLVHGTIVMDSGSAEMYLQASKVERQIVEDEETVSVSFADGSTLTENLLTVKYGEGESTPAIQNIWDSTGEGAVAGGNSNSEASGNYSFAFGNKVKATGVYSFSSGKNNLSSGEGSHTEGAENKATALYSHAEGFNTQATNGYSHSEGQSNKATGIASHAEGSGTTASGNYSHAEGLSSTATEQASHAEGENTTATSLASHAEGSYTEARSKYSHSEGYYTIARGEYQHVSGAYNLSDSTSLEIIGNGTDANSRSNARTLDRSGNEYLAGQIQPENGLRLKAPNGTYYNVTVDNNGALSIVAAT